MNIQLAAVANIACRGAAMLLAGYFMTNTAAYAQADAKKSRTQIAMEAEWNYMLGGSGEWRTANPDFADPKTTPKEYAVRFRWGPYKQHVAGELVGVFPTADGEKTALYWHFYSYHNPVTDEIVLLQIGSNGTMGTGHFSTGEGGRNLLDQIFYNADGTMKAMRHETIHTSETEHQIHVYERNDTGAWEMKRQWIWRRVD